MKVSKGFRRCYQWYAHEEVLLLVVSQEVLQVVDQGQSLFLGITQVQEGELQAYEEQGQDLVEHVLLGVGFIIFITG